MESIATDLAKSTLEKLVDATIAESRYICCFTCIAEDFEKEKETLKAKRTRSDVTFWQEEADKLIQEDTKTKATCFFGWCPNFKWRYIRGKELANKTEEIKRLVDSRIENVGIPRGVAGVEYHSSQYYIPFKSRELKYKELLEALTNDDNYITGLQGMGGSGKTTLAKEVGKKLKESKKFDQVIDTAVSYTPDIKKIQDDIAGPLCLSLKDCTEPDRPKRLWSRLTNGEKILIILDDVWEDINFEEIGIPWKDNRNGCRILMTTRNLRTCKSMNCCKVIELELLPKEDAWMLLKNHAGLSDSSPQSILDKAGKIAEECKGLPIAIAVIASSLKGEQRPEEWDVALKSLQKSKPLHGDDENLDKIYKCLRYSYNNMMNEKAKRLFLLCSVFQEDEAIEVEILTRFSIGAGIVPEIDDSYDEGRSQVVVAKNKLIDSCLLLETYDERRVKMHDLVREVALRIANEEVKAVNTSNKKQKSLVEKATNLKYLLCEGKSMDVFSLGFDGSKLEILIIRLDEDGNDSVEIPYSFFQNMIGLPVLYLSHESFKETTLSLTQSIHSLTNLRSLYLVGFVLRDISSLRNLQCLETLDLRSCSMDELPCEIAELEKLKLLSLLGCTIRRNNPFEVIESCSSLEELYFKFSFPGDSSTVHQTRKLSIRRFQIVDSSSYLDEERNHLCGSKHLVQTSDSLQLTGLEGEWRNLIPDIILPEDEGRLKLAQLDLKYISQLQCLIDAKHIGSRVQNVFSKLVFLRLEEMENLEELCNGPLTLSNLKYMILINCRMLVTLFPLSTIQSLVLLETLRIENCEQLKSIITDEKEMQEEIVDGNHNKSGASLFPNLKYLIIESCPKLEFENCLHQESKDQLQDCSRSSGILFWSMLTLSNLKEVTLKNCPMLVTLFPLSTIQSLLLLQKLEIENCEQLKSIITDEKEKQEEIVDGNHNKSGASLFPNLKYLYIRGCPKLEFILPVVAGRDAPNLEVVMISDCVELKYIFAPYQHKQEKQNLHKESKDQLQDYSLSLGILFWSMLTLSNLKYMELYNCPMLVTLFPLSTIQSLVLLQELEIVDCEQLKSIITDEKEKQEEIVDGNNDINKSGASLFPNLKYLRIESCPKLEFILPVVAGRDAPSLEQIIIRDCVELKCIFGLYQHKQEEQNLHQELRVMVLEGLPNLVDIFLEYDQHTSSSVKTSCSKDDSKTQIESSVKKSCSKDDVKTQTKSESIKCNIFNWIHNKYRHKLRTAEFPMESKDQLQDCSLSSIIDEDTKNQRMSYLPRLQVLMIKECNNMKCVFPFSTSEMPPELEVLIIKEASMLEEVFRCESDKKVEISNVKCAVFVDLPRFCQGIEFHTVKDCWVQNCPKLSLIPTSTPTIDTIRQIILSSIKGLNVYYENQITRILKEILDDLQQDSEAKETSNQNPTIKATEDFPIKIKVQATSENELTSSQVNTNQSMHSNIAEHTQHVNDIESNEFISTEKQTKETLEIEQEFVEKLPGLEIQSDISLNERHSLEVKRNVEEGTTSSVCGKTIASPVDSESEDYEGQVAIPSFSVVNLEPTTSKNVANGDIQETSKSIIIQLEANAPENFPQTTEDSSFISIVTRELEQLVSNKHLALENLSLLIDFLVKNPSVRLTNNAHSDRFKGFAYTCLVELLKFLQTYSTLDVLGSNHSEFVGLLQDVRTLGFDKKWLDGVERRALFPALPFSKDPIQNILHSKRTLIQHLEDVKHQLEDIIIQQETQLLEFKATLSTPLGY